MDMEFIIFRMEKFIKDNEKIENNMDREKSFFLMDKFIKDNLKMD